MELLAGLSAAQIDLIGGIVGLVFTVAVLSYLIGDNPLYRVAIHLFTGIAIGYVTLVIWYQVLVPRLIRPLASGNTTVIALAIVPLVLFIFLIFKLSPNTSRLGNIGVAYLLGVGTAVALGGAITGTLLPQIQATWAPQGSVINAILIIIGVVVTLFYFRFWQWEKQQEEEPSYALALDVLSKAGQGLIVFTLGVVYGGLILGGLAAFGDRLIAISRVVLP